MRVLLCVPVVHIVVLHVVVPRAMMALGLGTTGADNEYEQQRRRNMARNAQMLSALLDKQPAY